MTSRRNLLLGSAAFSVYPSLGSHQAKGNKGAYPGIIRSDPWYSQSGIARRFQDNLSPQIYQHRAPWWATVDSPNHITCLPTQANMDMEIQLAAQAGYKYFAFDWNLPGLKNGQAGQPEMAASFALYSASAVRNLVKWAVIDGIAMWGCSTSFSSNNWQFQVNQMVNYFIQPNYATVLSGRPLIYILWNAAEVKNWFSGSLANVATAITYLRSKCSAAQIGNPYIEVMGPTGRARGTIISSIGADAASAYMARLRGSASAAPNSASVLIGRHGRRGPC